VTNDRRSDSLARATDADGASAGSAVGNVDGSWADVPEGVAAAEHRPPGLGGLVDQGGAADRSETPKLAADRARFHHVQGQNDLGYQGTCGLVATEGVLRDLGHHVTENDVVHVAKDNDLCVTTAKDPTDCGGTTADSRNELLAQFGEQSAVETSQTIGDMAQHVEHGKGVIANVNAGELWDDPNYYDFGASNHAVVVTDVERDSVTGVPRSFWINDSSSDDGAAVKVDSDKMSRAFGGALNVTRRSRPTNQ
jgi:hypothetical protein